MNDTYQKMVQHPLIQGMWKPKVVDEYFDTLTDCFVTIGSDDSQNLQSSVIIESIKRTAIWKPSLKDWVEVLKGKGVMALFEPQETVVIVPLNCHFRSNSSEEAFCQAFMWTQGWKWEGKWEERG